MWVKWVKVDVGLPDHQKLTQAALVLGRDGWARALGVYVAGLCWSGRNTSDGFLPRHTVDGFRQVTNPLSVAGALVKVGLWEDAPNGFQIHDYADYQIDAATVKEKRQKDRDRKAVKESSRIPRGIPLGNLSESDRNPEGKDASISVSQVLSSSKQDLSKSETLLNEARTVLETPESIRWFDKVYAIYPNKDRKLEANRVWIDLAPSLEVSQAIWGDINQRVKFGWQKFERRFIPQLRNYLQERMWEEDPTPIQAVYEDDSVPLAWTCRACGQIHEGTRAQKRSGICLTQKVG